MREIDFLYISYSEERIYIVMSLLLTKPINSIGGTFFVSFVTNHSSIKGELLERFSKRGRVIREGGDSISRTDWGCEGDVNYLDILQPIMDDHITNVIKLLCPPDVANIKAEERVIWFQQYERNDEHDWHYHGDCNLSSIYYVELPEGTPITKFSMFGREFSVNVKEGCILSFPSLYPHCSPMNESLDRKSVISFNLNIGHK